ncbi:recombinase family protein [[Clostridium] symbiosum]|uniref:recombinase family protein n=1 Tax=Clostridium symbiosum TaxID=1512 RepID=UPI001D0794BC|nr:recombinase family protein [[Clostridium] symbiosum]MCB6608447.1 recombinase family protein [[Clostridium] symbiosum]MCB6930661.1 recombinase family protein [[Clostridium] symbiosum]
MRHNLQQFMQWLPVHEKGLPKWVIGIYLRLSKEDMKKLQKRKKNYTGEDLFSESILFQIKYIGLFLQQIDDFMIYDIYIDDGLTGTDFERGEYQRLQQDIDNNIVNCFIVKDITRFVRNLADGIKELDSYVLEKNVRFICCGEPAIDTFKDPHAITSPEVYQAFQNAEDVARITSVKIRITQETKRAYGEPLGGFPTYGYMSDPNPFNKNWIIDPVASKIVRQIFEWSSSGISDKQIARKLNEQGIPNPTKYKQEVLKLNYHNPNSDENSGLWSPSTVSRILSNKSNLGFMVQKKSSSFDHKRHKQIPTPKEKYQLKENCHESIINNDMFEDVEVIRKRRTRISEKTGEVHLFAGLVYCSDCKKAMRKTNAKNNNYLVCRTYREHGKKYCNDKHSINFKTLEEIILKLIQVQINYIENLQGIVNEINQCSNVKNESTRLNLLIESTKINIEKNNHLLDNFYYDWKKDDISKEQYQRLRVETEEKISRLTKSLQVYLLEQSKIMQGIKSKDKYFETFLKYKSIKELDREVLVELIDRIEITAEKGAIVTFRYRDSLSLILDFIEENKPENIVEKQKKYIKKK